MRITAPLRVLLAGIASAASAQAARPVHPAQPCTSPDQSTPRRAIGPIVDSVALPEEVRRFRDRGDASEPISMVSIFIGKEGRPARINGYRRSGPVRDTRSFQRALQPHVKPQEPTQRGFSLYMELFGEGTPEARVARSDRICEPVLMNREDVARLSAEAYERVRRKRRPGEGELRLRRTVVLVRIDEEGRPLEARMDESSGNSEMDIELRGVALRARFAPARLDDCGVGVWVSLPLSVSLR
jgi:TonB family protein